MRETITGKRKAWAILSYFGILVLFPLLKKQDDGFIRFHAKQGLVLLFFGVALSLFVRIAIEGKLGGMAGVVYGVELIFMLFGIMNCVRGEKRPLPLIGKIAEKITV